MGTIASPQSEQFSSASPSSVDCTVRTVDMNNICYKIPAIMVDARLSLLLLLPSRVSHVSQCLLGHKDHI